jgi:hypothetical protein
MGLTTKTTIRKIATRDWYWLIKDFLDITLACGHSPSQKQAMEDARSAKKNYFKQQKAGLKKLKRPKLKGKL